MSLDGTRWIEARQVRLAGFFAFQPALACLPSGPPPDSSYPLAASGGTPKPIEPCTPGC
nr:MAG TPA: hypothetical protein [Caudoviricetes sp.]